MNGLSSLAFIVLLSQSVPPLPQTIPLAPASSVEPAQIDAVDLWGKIRHKPPAPVRDQGDRMFAIAPVVSSKPSSGFAAGIGGSLAVFRGDPKTTRISSGVGALTVSTKKQTSITARFGVFAKEDRWRVEGDNRALWTSQDIYGLGMNTTQAD